MPLELKARSQRADIASSVRFKCLHKSFAAEDIDESEIHPVVSKP